MAEFSSIPTETWFKVGKHDHEPGARQQILLWQHEEIHFVLRASEMKIKIPPRSPKPPAVGTNLQSLQFHTLEVN